MGIEKLDELGEIGKRSRQPVDLIDDHHIDPPLHDVGKQFLQRRALHGTAGKATVVIMVAAQSPPFVRLAFDVGFRGLALGVERVKILLEPLVTRDTGVDRATQSGLGHGDASEPRRVPSSRLHPACSC